MKDTIKISIVTGLILSSTLVGSAAHASDSLKQESDAIHHVISEHKDNTAKTTLMARLNSFEQLSANFSQQVIDEEKNVLQDIQGKLALKKPNLVNWQNIEPEESLIVSDGETLWFFDPFIEQVTAYTVNASIASTPVLLLSSSDEALWQQFSISQYGNDQFLIHSKDENSRIKTLELHFVNGSAKIDRFSLLDSTGQLSVFSLQEVTLEAKLPDSLFQFTLPEGVELDDQR